MHAEFRLYAELNDFLPQERRGKAFTRELAGRPSVKEAIESLGVPHSEVDLVLCNGESVSFDAPLQDGARVAVYPVFERMDIAALTKVRAEPLRDVRFVLDAHLGQLARYLRMLGLDTAYPEPLEDGALVGLANAQKRIILTRDRDLLKRRAVTHGYWIRGKRVRDQAAEVLRQFDLWRKVSPFSRCLECNVTLIEAEPDEVKGTVPEPVRARHQTFRRCPTCQRVYWAGSHHRRMETLLAELLTTPNSSGRDD